MNKENTHIENARIEDEYGKAKEIYVRFGVDTDLAIQALATIPVSIHCWQGDDVVGFEGASALSSGGILTTGNHPGRARNAEELRQDMEFAFTLIPGKKRVNLHAMYAETGGVKVDRDAIEPEHFRNWLEWAKARNLGLDFNPTFFSHPLAESGFTLSHPNEKVRDFWVRHSVASRRIAQYFADELKEEVVNNLWIPDGFKDTPADRLGPRLRLQDSLNEVYRDPLPNDRVINTVESKLFGIGSESYVVGSHEFYMGYAVKKNIGLCLDMGHFHPTENVSDKLSSILLFVPHLVVHMSRGVRWDSDHIVVWNDDVQNVCKELVRLQAWDRIHIALDYFDASMNRIAAWAIGARSVQKALLSALLDPIEMIRDNEKRGNFSGRLALMEETKNLPFSGIWDNYCMSQGVPVLADWMHSVDRYETKVLKSRY
jgi:L-rhamnose isomerase